ncbi:MAG: aminotransferase class I/II-fold pyridoxal phosphate-dependent enzyme [Candidatus Heimdallarchaeota archaeon]
MRISDRAQGIRYAIRDIVIEANKIEKATGKPILRCNIGDPTRFDFAPPSILSKALAKAVQDKAINSGYADSQGLLELREEISKLEHEKNIYHPPENILITQGVSEGIEFLMGAIEPGDEVLIPGPHYPTYEGFAKFLGVVPRDYLCDEENGWQPDLDDLEKKINKKTQGIVIINPNNPTGTIFSEKTVRQICNLAGQHDLVLVSDEIYDELCFSAEKITPTAKIAGEVPILSFNGISKTLVAPGWRVGWAMMHDPENLASIFWDVLNRQSRIRLSASSPEQAAVAKVLNKSETWSHLKTMKEKLQRRRDLIVKRMTQMDGVSITSPEGAFYAFPKLNHPKWKDDDWGFALELLKTKQVLIVPGSGFGKEYGSGHFRLVFLPQDEILSTAMDSLDVFLAS